MQDAQTPARQILESPRHVHDSNPPGPRRPGERNRQRIDAEIASQEILLQRTRSDLGERAVARVMLAAHRREIESRAIPLEVHRAEPVVNPQLEPPTRNALREFSRAFAGFGLDGEVDVPDLATHEPIANRPTHQVHPQLARLGAAEHLLKELGGRSGKRPEHLGRRRAPQRPDRPRGCRRSTVSRRRLRLTWV